MRRTCVPQRTSCSFLRARASKPSIRILVRAQHRPYVASVKDGSKVPGSRWRTSRFRTEAAVFDGVLRIRVQQCVVVRDPRNGRDPAPSSCLDCGAASLRYQVHAELVEKASIGICLRIWCGEKRIPHEDRVCACHEAQCLRLLRQSKTAGTQAYHRGRHQNASRGDGSDELERVNGRLVCQRRSFNPDEHVDGDAFRVGSLHRKLPKQPVTLLAALTHSNDSTTTDRDPCVAYARQSVESLLVSARRDDFAVEIR